MKKASRSTGIIVAACICFGSVSGCQETPNPSSPQTSDSNNKRLEGAPVAVQSIMPDGGVSLGAVAATFSVASSLRTLFSKRDNDPELLRGIDELKQQNSRIIGLLGE